MIVRRTGTIGRSARLGETKVPASGGRAVICRRRLGAKVLASASGAAGQGHAKIVQDVIHADYAAFYPGLQAAPFVSAAGLFTLIMLRKPGPPPGDTSNPLLADASGPSRSR